jgi:putative ABC transport system permease protein
MLRLILRELLFRKGHAFLMLSGLVSVSALATAYFTTETAAARETTRVARDLGFNLRILPKETDMDAYWFQGFSDHTLPEESVNKLANADGVFMTFNHLMASLRQKIMIQGREVVLVGVAPTVTSPDKKKRPMGFSIDPGKLHVGYQIGVRLGLKAGDTLNISGQDFEVERVMVEYGTEEDIYVYGSLKDVQTLTDKEGRINEIKAIDCLCLTSDQDPASILRAELEKMLPDAKVIQDRVQADARARQRQMVQKKFAFLSPFLMTVGAVWVAVLSVLNVRERRSEIGVWRALGKGGVTLGGMFLGKAILLGLLGGFIGFWIGNALALSVGSGIFQVTAKAIQTEWSYLVWSVIATPVLAAAAAFIPAMMAVVQDPADTLRES